MPRRRGLPYSDGELNKLVDAALHPKAKQDPYYWLLDTVLHGIVEQDPEITIRKFAKYTLPKIIEQAMRKSKPRKHRAH